MFKNIKEALSLVGLVLVIALTLSISNCAGAQEGVVPTQQQTIEELLTVPGPVNMNLVWDYVIYEFGDPNVAGPVVMFEAGIDGQVFHIQAITSATDESGEPGLFHVDIPLEAFSPGGAVSNDGLFQFIWFCSTIDTDPEIGCLITNAMFIFAYDGDQRALLAWPERMTR
jgi:hypothetical protein